MTILYSGNGTIRFPVAAGNSLKIRNLSGVETVTGSSAGREDASSSIGAGFVVYGPQSVDTTITLSTTGQCDYQVVAGDPTPNTSTSSGAVGLASLKSLLSASQPQPFFSEKHIATIAAWSAKTYRTGEVIQNGGNLYGVLGDNLVSTAAPTGVSTKPTADPGDGASGTDSKGWVYLGPVRQDAFLATDVVSYTQSSTAPSLGATFNANDANCPLMRIPQAKWSPSGHGKLNGVQLQPFGTIKNPLGGGGNVEAVYAWFSILTDEPAIGWRDTALGSPTDGGFAVDGVPYHPGSALVANGANLFRTITFNGRRWRRISFPIGLMSNFYCASGNVIMLPNEADLSRSWLAIGDSYFAGAAPSNAFPTAYWASHVARELGLPMPVQSAVGGTGFVQGIVNSVPLGTYRDRLTADLSYHQQKSYKFVLLQGSGNDNGVTTSAAYKAEVVATLQMIRSQIVSATTPIFVTTLANTDTVTIGSAATMQADLIAAVQSLNDPYVYLIPMSTDMQGGIPLLNPTAASSYIGATDKHPFLSGNIYLGKHVANQIRGLVNAA
jgi:hypothetical protein